MIYVVCKRTSSFWEKEVDVVEFATTAKEKAEAKLKELQERFALAVKVCEDWRADCKKGTSYCHLGFKEVPRAIAQDSFRIEWLLLSGSRGDRILS